MVDCTELCLGGRAELTGREIEFLDDLEAGGVARGDDNSGTSFRGTGNGTSICVDPEIYLAALKFSAPFVSGGVIDLQVAGEAAFPCGHSAFLCSRLGQNI